MLFKNASWATRFLMPLILTTSLVQAASLEQTSPLYSSQELRNALTDLNAIGENNVTNSLNQSDDPLSLMGLSDAENVLDVFEDTQPLAKETISPIELDQSRLEAKDYALKVMVQDNQLIYHDYGEEYSDDDDPQQLEVFLVPINQKTIKIEKHSIELITVREAQERGLFTPNVLINIVHSNGEAFIKDIISKNKNLEEDREILREYAEKIPHFTMMPDGSEKERFEQGEIYYNFDSDPQGIDTGSFDTQENIQFEIVSTVPDFEIKLLLSDNKLFIPPDNVIYAWSMPKTSNVDNDLVTIAQAFDKKLLTKDTPPIILIMKRPIAEVSRILRAPENAAMRHEFMLLNFLNDLKGVPIITTESGDNKKNLVIIDPSGEVITNMTLEEWKAAIKPKQKSSVSPLSRSKSSEDLATEAKHKKDKKHHHSKSKHHHKNHHKRSKSSEDFERKEQEKMPARHHNRSLERDKFSDEIIIRPDDLYLRSLPLKEEMKTSEYESPLNRSKSVDTPREDEKTQDVPTPLTRKNSLPPLPSKEKVKEKGIDLSDALKLERPSGPLERVKSFFEERKKKKEQGGEIPR